MTGYLRLAGTGSLADGSRLVWSVADGRRGRRWRSVASLDAAISHALLLEVDPDGRPGRLELTTTAGMLTLHPDEAPLAPRQRRERGGRAPPAPALERRARPGG